MIKRFIIDCLISYHSICYTLWWWVIYFLTCPLLYIKLVQIVVKIFIYFWTICEEQTQFLYQGGRWMYFTHRMDWTNKFEEDGSLFVKSKWWNFLGRKVIHLVILLTYFKIMIKFQWCFTTNLVGLLKEAQNRASDVEMKDVFSSHGRWEIPWPSSLTYSLNIIDYCVVEVMRMVLKL